MKLQEYYSKLPSLLKSTWKSIGYRLNRFSKKVLWIGGLILLAIIIVIILFATGVLSASTFKSQPANTETQVYDASKDTFQRDLLTSDTISIKNNSGLDIAVVIPVTGNKKTDEAIRSQAMNFAEEVGLVATENETYINTSYTYKDYIFVTYHNVRKTSAVPVFTTLAYTSKGALSKPLVKKSGYVEDVTAFAASEIQNRYRVDTTTSAQLVSEALQLKTMRLASNGLVIQIPSDKVSETAGTRYYEILVPNKIVEKYLK